MKFKKFLSALVAMLLLSLAFSTCNAMERVKVMFFGEQGVGKTQIINRLLGIDFEYDSDYESDSYEKVTEVAREDARQEPITNYFGDSVVNIGILVVDFSNLNEDSILFATTVAKKLKEEKPDAKLFLVGNKLSKVTNKEEQIEALKKIIEISLKIRSLRFEFENKFINGYMLVDAEKNLNIDILGKLLNHISNKYFNSNEKR